MTRAANGPVRLTAAQTDVLRAVAAGEVTWLRDMGWFQKGGWRRKGGRKPTEATMRKLRDLGLVKVASGGMGTTHSDVVVTSEGKAVLDSIFGPLCDEDGS